VPISGGPRELFYQGESFSQLAVAAGLVYTLDRTSGDTHVVTIDEATRAAHAAPAPSETLFTDEMIADADGVYCSSAFETIAIDSESGAELWQVDGGGTELALDPEHLYIGDGPELLRTPRAR
jgi:hypothetical protein